MVVHFHNIKALRASSKIWEVEEQCRLHLFKSYVRKNGRSAITRRQQQMFIAHIPIFIDYNTSCELVFFKKRRWFFIIIHRTVQCIVHACELRQILICKERAWGKRSRLFLHIELGRYYCWIAWGLPLNATSFKMDADKICGDGKKRTLQLQATFLIMLMHYSGLSTVFRITNLNNL